MVKFSLGKEIKSAFSGDNSNSNQIFLLVEAQYI